MVSIQECIFCRSLNFLDFANKSSYLIQGANHSAGSSHVSSRDLSPSIAPVPEDNDLSTLIKSQLCFDQL